jgi:hypothetical protein
MEESLTDPGARRPGAGTNLARLSRVRLGAVAGAVMVLIVAQGACSKRAPPPTPETTASAPPPSLTGATVMLLPAQPGPGGSIAREPVPGLDAELAFWLAERAPRVSWVFPEEIERILARSPSIEIDLHALAVSSFHAAQVRNIGDPLFGDLNRLGALTNSRAALVPVAAGWIGDGAGSGAVQVSLALIDNRTGRVIWYGVAEGEPGPEGSREVAASAAEAVAALVSR